MMLGPSGTHSYCSTPRSRHDTQQAMIDALALAWPYGCFHELGVLFAGVLTLPVLLCGVHFRALSSWKQPHGNANYCSWCMGMVHGNWSFTGQQPHIRLMRRSRRVQDDIATLSSKASSAKGSMDIRLLIVTILWPYGSPHVGSRSCGLSRNIEQLMYMLWGQGLGLLRNSVVYYILHGIIFCYNISYDC